MNVRQAIVDQLFGGEKTIAELATALGVTRNAVVVQLRVLRDEGLVAETAERSTGKRGKPARRFVIAAGQEDTGSSAYGGAIRMLIETLAENLSDPAVRTYLHEAGRKLARSAGLAPRDDFTAALRHALDVVNGLGARAETTTTDDETIVQSFRCPLANAVRGDPRTCGILVGFLSEATGVPVIEACHRANRIICEYRLAHNDRDVA